MKTVINIDGRELPDYLDGDWQITYCYEDFFVGVSVVASNPEQALRYAEDRLPTLEEEPIEINAKLVGVYGGMTE